MPNSLLGVELARVGTFDLAIGGRRSFTLEDFNDAVAASADPDFGAAIVRPGHTDPRFDGEPALGRVANLRVVADRLVGDVIDLPGWLGARIAAAYPERSIEGYTGVTSPTGRTYRLVLTSVALLGVAAPAMAGLAALPAAIAAAVRIAASSSLMGLPGPESERPTTDPATVTGDEPPEGSLMDPSAIRSALGLAADATDEQVTEALAGAAAARAAATAAQAEAAAAAARIAELEAAATADTPPPAIDGMTAIDSTQLADLVAAAAQGREAHATLRAQERGRFIATHIAAGRLAPSNAELRASLEREWDRDPEAAQRVAASLAVVMPTTPIGLDGGVENTGDDAIYNAVFGTTKGA